MASDALSNVLFVQSPEQSLRTLAASGAGGFGADRFKG